MTVDVMGELEAAIEQVAAGGETTAALTHEVYLINTSPLDESAGEGYHRTTNLVRLHCPGSTSAYIKQSCRLEENCVLMKTFLKQHGMLAGRLLGTSGVTTSDYCRHKEKSFGTQRG